MTVLGSRPSICTPTRSTVDAGTATGAVGAAASVAAASVAAAWAAAAAAAEASAAVTAQASSGCKRGRSQEQLAEAAAAEAAATEAAAGAAAKQPSALAVSSSLGRRSPAADDATHDKCWRCESESVEWRWSRSKCRNRAARFKRATADHHVQGHAMSTHRRTFCAALL